MPARDDDDDRDDRPRRRRPREDRGGLPVWAVLLIVFGVMMVFCVPLGIGLLLPAVQKVREAAARVESQNNMKQVAMAAANYEATNARLPSAFVRPPTGTPPADPARRLSWRVDMLPYIEQSVLYQGVNPAEAWDGPATRRVADAQIKTYSDPGGPPGTLTRYRAFVGPGAAFEPDGAKVTRRDVTDGTSNTILFVEAADQVPWAQYAELPFSPAGLPPPLGRVPGRGFNAAFADGSVRFIGGTVAAQTLNAAITRAGGEALPVGWENP